MANPATSRSESIAIPWAPLLFASGWIWASWSCAEHWRGNPNYSYGWAVPFLALGFGLRRYFALPSQDRLTRQNENALAFASTLALSLLAAALVFVLEFARQDMWHPQIVLLLICFLPIALSLVLFAQRGRRKLWRAEIFPVAFFLTAVPWPARLEQPITSMLMRWVVAATAELLHWLGIEAETSGAAIALRSGLVGITEACSGIRSLQAGIMFGLAMGEWFLLRPARRILLVAVAIVAALLTNLARTLALSLQAEWHGVQSVEQVHDLIGNVAITSLIIVIWLAGKMLAAPRTEIPPPSLGELRARLRAFLRMLRAPASSAFAWITIASLAGLIAARGVYSAIETREHTQLAPFFVAAPNEQLGDHIVPVPKEIWNELRPSAGEYIHRANPELPRGVADFYHFFWKPSPWNRFALVHRPDVCMPGIGWQSSGAPVPVEIDFAGRKIRFYAFRFQRGQFHALQMWGVWRNGEPVSLDYNAAQVLGDAEPPPALQLEGKRRSATEIVACSIFSEENEPPAEIAMALLPSVFKYKPR